MEAIYLILTHTTSLLVIPIIIAFWVACITAGLVMFYFVCRVALAFIPSEWKYRKYKELRETMEEWRRRYEEENN